MTRTPFLTLLASAALLAAPSFAAAPGKGKGPKAHSSAAGTVGETMRATARAKSKGPAHASTTGIAHSSPSSVLHGSTVATGPLSGLAIGSTVTDSNGNAVGTVRKILASADGTVRKVLVRSANGRRTIPLAASALSLSGSTVVASSWPGRR
ncbi:MAG TPA: hypothetical protein VFS45_01515 [Sphingomicrobium sp.]|nr:hypothetical protein [Sphingomicrobium sp.]